MSLNDLLQRHLARPASRYMQSLRARARHVNAVLDGPAALDQYPGRRVPWIYTRLFSVAGPVAARRWATGTAPEQTATVAGQQTFITPREGPVRVGRNGTFVWTRASTSAYISLNFTADPAFAGETFDTWPSVNTGGDIFDPVVGANGGALWCGSSSYVAPLDPAEPVLYPTVSYDIGLYDRKRGAYLHSGERLPIHLFSGQRFANRSISRQASFDANADIDVRLFVNEIKMGNVLDTETALAAARLRTYIFVNFIGYIEQTDNHASDTGE